MLQFYHFNLPPPHQNLVAQYWTALMWQICEELARHEKNQLGFAKSAMFEFLVVSISKLQKFTLFGVVKGIEHN